MKINLHDYFPLLCSFQTNINYFRADRIAWGTVLSRERYKEMLLPHDRITEVKREIY
jgi:hypothetical protein